MLEVLIPGEENVEASRSGALKQLTILQASLPLLLCRVNLVICQVWSELPRLPSPF